MIDWAISFILETIRMIIVGILGFIIGFWIYNKFFLPKQSVQIGSNLIKTAKQDPEFAPFIDRAKQLINILEPIMKDFKTFDLNGLKNDIKPLLETAKRIDPQKIDELLTSAKNLIDQLTKATEKPKIPSPD